MVRPVLANLPVVLNVEGRVVTARGADVVDTVVDDEVAVVATAMVAVRRSVLRLIGCDDCVAGRGRGADGVVSTVVEIDFSRVVAAEQIVTSMGERISTLEVVGSGPSGLEVGEVDVELLASQAR